MTIFVLFQLILADAWSAICESPRHRGDSAKPWFAIAVDLDPWRRRVGGRMGRCIGILSLAVALTACGEEMLPTEITGYNHMTDPDGWSIGGFAVDGHSGANASPGGGAGNSCCMSLPKHWHAGMTVKVEWSYDRYAGSDRTPPAAQTAVVEVPEYTVRNSGAMQVHFYSNHRVKVVVSRYGIENPRYPMSDADKKPWETDKTLIDWQAANPEE